MMKKAILWGVVALALFALGACSDDGPDDPPPPTPPVLKLTITGIPSDLSPRIMVATLLKDGTQMSNAVAVGFNSGGSFSFYKFIPGPPMSFGAPYTALGEYYIVLATQMDGSPPNYEYRGSGASWTEYNFTALTGTTLAWSDFALQN
jgi:hypothetical protein